MSSWLRLLRDFCGLGSLSVIVLVLVLVLDL